jgi:hypothetical protein
MRRSGCLSYRALCLAVAALTGFGCSTWQVQAGPPRAAPIPPSPLADPVRVMLLDGRVLVVHHPHVVADSLFGVVRENQRAVNFRAATAEIKWIEVRKTDEARTIVATFVVIGVLAGLVFAISFGSSMGN